MIDIVGWFKGLFGAKGATQVGSRNKSISGITVGDNAGGVVVGDRNSVSFQQVSPPEKPVDFTELEKMMPELLAEMKDDIAQHPLSREFIVVRSTNSYVPDPNNLPFSYFTDKHDNLIAKMKLLEDKSLVRDVTRSGGTPRYRFTDTFIRYLTKVV